MKEKTLIRVFYFVDTAIAGLLAEDDNLQILSILFTVEFKYAIYLLINIICIILVTDRVISHNPTQYTGIYLSQ